MDDRNETIDRSIRDAELQKVPMMLIVGEDEEKSGSVSVRIQDDGDKG